MLNIRLLTIFLILISFTSAAMGAKKISGRVLDGENQPVIGANVYWEKSRKGTTTDLDGRFELNRVASEKKLVASYIGYTPAIVEVNDSDEEINIFLKGEIELQEVVVSERRAGTIASRTSV